MTKPIQGTKFTIFRNKLLGIDPLSLSQLPEHHRSVLELLLNEIDANENCNQEIITDHSELENAYEEPGLNKSNTDEDIIVD